MKNRTYRPLWRPDDDFGLYQLHLRERFLGWLDVATDGEASAALWEEASDAERAVEEHARGASWHDLAHIPPDLVVKRNAAIGRWAERYELHHDAWPSTHATWALQHALSQEGTISLGRLGPPLPDPTARESIGELLIRHDSHLPPPHFGPFVPGWDEPDEYVRAVTAQVRKYVERALAEARSEGQEEPSEKRKLDLHLWWLVRHQCLRVPYDRCDESPRPKELGPRNPGGADKSTVKAAIDSTAPLLPLRLRDAPGRST